MFQDMLLKLKDWILDYYPSIISAVLVFIIGFIIIKVLVSLTKKILAKSKIEATMHHFITSAVKVVLYVLLATIIAAVLKVPTAPLIASLSAVGLAVSLAVKDNLANLASGVVILFNHPFKLGDYIEVDGESGTVCEIGFTYTQLSTFDNKIIYIPNSRVSSNNITNYSAMNMRRLDIVFGVSYTADTDEAKKIIMQAVTDSALALKDPEPFVGICNYGESSVDITCRVWVNLESYWDLNFYLYDEVKKRFDKAGIEIPFKQIDVHVTNS